MRPYRDLKIANVIEEELGKILSRDFYVDGVMLTIVGVSLDPDLLHARIKVAIIPYEKGLEAFEALNARQKEFQHKLLKKMNIKPMPQIKFEIEEQNTAT